MTVSTSPPPQRRLPRQSERRRELVALISEPARPSHNRWLVPASAAASVALVAAGVVLSATVIRGQPASPTSTAPPVGGSPTSASSPADSAKFLNPPPSHAMSAAEMSAAFADCVADSGGDWTAGFEPALGRVFDLNRSAPERTTRTWLVAHKLGGPFDDLMVCTKSDADPGYSITSSKSDTGTNIPYVRDLVEIHSEGFGRYTAPVATITVAESESTPQVRAVLDRGYWFLPTKPYPVDSFPPDTTIVRGYSQDGRLVFDSRTVEPHNGCLADPSGTAVVMGADLNVPPEQCRRTYPWHFGR